MGECDLFFFQMGEIVSFFQKNNILFILTSISNLRFNEANC